MPKFLTTFPLVSLLVLATSFWFVAPLQLRGSELVTEGGKELASILSTSCYDCHSGVEPEAGLDLQAMAAQRLDANLPMWVKVHDRIAAGEMPPEGLADELRTSITRPLFAALVEVDRKSVADSGRAVLRRMNRFEYENSLRLLLHAPWLQLKSILPEDGEQYRFNKIGEALDVSHVNMARYMQAADYALREVVATRVHQPKAKTQRYYARDQQSFNRRVHFNEFNRSPERATFPLIDYSPDLNVLNNPDYPFSVGEADPELREREAFGVVASSYEPIEIRFSAFKAPQSGRYKLRFKGYTFWAEGEEERWWRPRRDSISIGRRSEPIAVYSQSPPRQLRKLGTFDFQVQPTVQELDAWLLEGESIQPDAVRLFRSRPSNWHNPLAEKDGMPGVAFSYLEVEGPIFEHWPPPGHVALFGDLPLERINGQVTVVSSNPDSDSRRLLERFVQAAYRRPATAEEIDDFQRVIDGALANKTSFFESMLAGYTAVLCSPGFICIEEEPGTLQGLALATRLSMFLTNAAPDDTLREEAVAGELSDPSRLNAAVERLLDSDRSRDFISSFLAYWLDLRRINDTSPDEVLYPDYYLDDALVDAALEETELFFAELVRQNLPARNLIDSDFTFVNERLAHHYDLPAVEGAALRRIVLPEDSPRGGLLTQASVLKVTANGTTTSPVVRGAWINERILGVRIPPPPKSVPAIEPDTRGATTIRQQLDLHRADPSCNVCHRQMDPAGFALESFDVAGGYREYYRSLGDSGEEIEGYGKNGQKFTFRRGPDVDCSGELPSGERFANVIELKSLLARDERAIARNLLHKLLLFSTGAPPRISDREEVENILDRLESDHFPVRSMIHEVVASRLFTNK